MYVCKEHLCPHRQPYSLDCHGGAIKMHHCALENMTDFSCAQNWDSDSDGSRTSVEVSWIEPVQNMQSFFVHIALSCSMRWRGCLALLNVNDSVWQLLQPRCITRRGRWVLTDVDTYIRARTSCNLCSVELAAIAAGREWQQWYNRVCLRCPCSPMVKPLGCHVQ